MLQISVCCIYYVIMVGTSMTPFSNSFSTLKQALCWLQYIDPFRDFESIRIFTQSKVAYHQPSPEAHLPEETQILHEVNAYAFHF